MKSQARVVIVGGGIMGVGLLYHLVEEGWSDVVLVEKGELTSGSTWHAAGQCPHFNGSLNLTKMHVYGTELYPRLEALTGVAVSWHGCGGVRLAFSDDEVDWFKYVHGLSRLAGYEAAIVGPNEIKTHHPFAKLTTSRRPSSPLPTAMSRRQTSPMRWRPAPARGATIYRRCRATDIRRLPSGEWEVVTERGNIRCEHVVNAAGSYADVVGGWTGHAVPIANLLHHYVITEPLQELIDLDKELPVLRDPSSHAISARRPMACWSVPMKRRGPICASTAARLPGISWELVPPELERLMPWLEKAGERLPLFNRAGVKSVISGAITHTPDSNFLLGPAHGAPGYWTANGASIGICQGAGAGKYLAQWMVHGQAEINMREFDPRRFGPWAAGDYAKVTAIEDYHHMYYCYRPGEQHAAGRGCASRACRPARRGGCAISAGDGMGTAALVRQERRGRALLVPRSNWFEAVREECLAVRNAVGLMDLSSFAKFELKGKGAHAALSRLTANRIPSRDGGIVLAHMLTEAGFIESELTITRLGSDHYFLLSAATAELQDEDLLQRGLTADGAPTLANVTEAYGTLILAGPKSREVLASLTEVDLANASFPWLTGRIITVAGAEDVRALRINYVGELGYELHCPMASMPSVFDALMREGARHGITLFGTYAMNSLRMEKAYRAWGAELTNEVTMIEGAMERFVDLAKDFVGKAGTLKSKQDGPRIQLVYLEVAATDFDCRGNEPVYHDGRLVGITTGGAYGHAVGKSLAFAYVEPALATSTGELAVELYGERHAARIIPEAGL